MGETISTAEGLSIEYDENIACDVCRVVSKLYVTMMFSENLFIVIKYNIYIYIYIYICYK